MIPYLVQALKIYMSAIFEYANMHDLYVCSRQDDICSTGIIDVKLLSKFSDLNGYILCLQRLGFSIQNVLSLNNGYFRIIINGCIL